MKTKSKVLTVLLALMSVIVAIVVLGSTVFCVSSIKVVWHTTTNAFTGQDTQVIEQSGLVAGESVFLIGKQTSIEKLESAYPYLKVLSIETVFPSTLNLHVLEREALFAVQTSATNYIILDQDFKVLESKTGVYNSFTNNAILLNADFGAINIKVADFLSQENYNTFKSLQINFEKMDFNIIQLKAFIKDASFQNNRMILNTFFGVQIQIFAPTVRQQEKVAMVLKVFDTLTASKRGSGIIGVYEDNNNVICGSHHSA